jgi:hypothetical protein
MSEQDVIYISCDDFKHYRETTTCIKVTKLYEDILARYDCFTKPEIATLKFSSKFHVTPNKTNLGSHGGHGSHNNYKFDKRPNTNVTYKSNNHYNKSTNQSTLTNQASFQIHALKRPTVGKAEDTVLGNVRRKLKGYLNIINRENFSKISKKVKMLVSKEALQIIVEDVLETSCMQVFYVDIFDKLINEILACAPESFRPDAYVVIDKFIDDFIVEQKYVYKESLIKDCCENNQLGVREQQKHKAIVTSRNIVVIELLKNTYSKQWCSQSYGDSLLEELNFLNMSSIEDSSKNYIEFNSDVVITLLKELIIRCRKVDINLEIIKDLQKINESQRIRFMIEDIIKLC